MNKKKSYIFGNEGFAKEIFDQVFSVTLKEFGGFIVLKNDRAFVLTESGTQPFLYPDNVEFIIGTGSKKWRKLFMQHFLDKYPASINHFPNIVHSTAYISKLADTGIGNTFCPFSLINGNPVIGNFNNINVYSTVSHDCLVGDYNILSPYSGIMGRCTIGSNNFFGANCVITPDVNIGDDNTVSAGEVVFDNMTNREFFQSGIVYEKSSK